MIRTRVFVKSTCDEIQKTAHRHNTDYVILYDALFCRSIEIHGPCTSSLLFDLEAISVWELS